MQGLLNVNLFEYVFVAVQFKNLPYFHSGAGLSPVPKCH